MEIKLDGKLMKQLYGEQRDRQPARYSRAIGKFMASYKRDEFIIISVPGRTELCGNHTDHQGGRVVAAAVDMDAIAVCAPREDNIFNIISEGYKKLSVDLGSLEVVESEKNTSSAFIRGVAAGYKKNGLKYGGADVFMTSDVPVGSGLSSSAVYSVAVASVFNHLYNDGEADAVTNAKVARFAENNYFGKPCGLMDQTAVAVGGVIQIDFADSENPEIIQSGFDLSQHGYSLCIINTGGSHADLTSEYAAIPEEMKKVAAYFGKELLSEVSFEDFFSQAGYIKAECGERPFIRAYHYFTENERVGKIAEAIEKDDLETLLRVENEGGRSSYMYLQNAFPICDVTQRGLCIACAVSERVLDGRGAYRIHGGGMAGTIQAFVPDDAIRAYRRAIERVFGEGSLTVCAIRPLGAVRVL